VNSDENKSSTPHKALPARLPSVPGERKASNTLPRTGMHSALARFVQFYRVAAIILLNAIVLLVVLNLLLLPVIAIRTALQDQKFGPKGKYSQSNLATVYPDLTSQERDLLLQETWARHQGYADYVMLREKPYQGRYVNVSQAGFRQVKNQGPWPPADQNLNVFVFGGSTTFGYGMPDEQTVPSFLQEVCSRHMKRRVCVYNFGIGSCYSTQERILLESLLSNGYRPHLAIFIDGMNECEHLDDRPGNAKVFQQAFDKADQIAFVGTWIQRLPMIRAANSLLKRFSGTSANTSVPWSSDPKNQKLLKEAIPRYHKNKAMIEAVCHQFSIVPVFVWQPVPGYQYELKYHLFPDPPIFEKEEPVYEEMKKSLLENPPDSNFIWCADLQRDAQECLYVDAVHYSAKFSLQFAEAICEQCLDRGLFKSLPQD
jgi:hypothetical protein